MKLTDILLENTLEYRVKFVTIKDKDVSQGSASYKDLADAKKFFDSLTTDPEVYRAQIDKVLGADSSRNMGGASFLGGTEEIERHSHPAIRSSKKFDELTPAEQDMRMFANSRLGTMGKKGFTSKDGSYKYLEEGFGDQIGAAASGIGKGIASVLNVLIGAVVAIAVLIITGAAGAIGGITALLGFTGVGIIKAVEQFIIIPSINSALKRLSEDEEVMAIAKKPSASGLRKIAEEKLTSGERLLVGNWIKKNVTRSMLGVGRSGRKTKRGPGLGKYDYMGLTEETSLEEGLAKSAIMRQIKDAEEILDSGEADGVPLDNETEMLVQQELTRLKRMLAMNETSLEELYNQVQESRYGFFGNSEGNTAAGIMTEALNEYEEAVERAFQKLVNKTNTAINIERSGGTDTEVRENLAYQFDKIQEKITTGDYLNATFYK